MSAILKHRMPIAAASYRSTAIDKLCQSCSVGQYLYGSPGPPAPQRSAFPSMTSMEAVRVYALLIGLVAVNGAGKL